MATAIESMVDVANPKIGIMQNSLTSNGISKQPNTPIRAIKQPNIKVAQWKADLLLSNSALRQC